MKNLRFIFINVKTVFLTPGSGVAWWLMPRTPDPELFYFFSNYLPLQIWTLKIYNHDISKTITARSFKLYQLIEDDE